MSHRGLLVLLLLTVTACGNADSPQVSPTPTGPIAGPDCADTHADTKRVTFGPGLTGIVAGTGTTGIVLAHQNGGSVCEWVPRAKVLASAGYRVLAFDFATFGGSPAGNDGMPANIAEAVKAIRAEGATKVVLIGASMGGTASVEAAKTITPPVQAVITLSSPTVFSNANAALAAPALTMPVLYVSGSGEPSFTRAAQELHALSKASTHAEVYIAEGTDAHGAWLITPGTGHQGASGAVTAFLSKHAPA